LLITILFLVLSHFYGKDGRDSKKIDTNSLILDFYLFQEFAKTNFITNVKQSLTNFVQSINDSQFKGIT
jgi:hypothetical protein